MAVLASVALHGLLLLVPIGETRKTEAEDQTIATIYLEEHPRDTSPEGLEPMKDRSSEDEPHLETAEKKAGRSGAAGAVKRDERSPRKERPEERPLAGKQPEERAEDRSIDEKEPALAPERDAEEGTPPLASDAPESPEQPIDPFPSSVLSELAAETEAETLDGPDPGETFQALPSEPPEERAALAEERLAGMVRDDKARHRVKTGLVDPYFVRLRESFEEDMDPGWEHLDEQAKEGLIADLGAWLRDYQKTLERYGETGSPYREGESSSLGSHHLLAKPIAPSGTLARDDSRVDMARAAMQHTLFRDMASGRAGGVELVALLRVVQAPNGGLIRVEIERSSGKPGYDELARSTVQGALSRMRPPERAGKGFGLGSERIESVWAFRTRFVVVPPMPMAGCEIESDGAAGECLRPLQRRAIPHVELEAVY